jgi:hypothetical protein
MGEGDRNLLLDAVDALTKPIRSKVIQDPPPGAGWELSHTVTVELPPLLQQLEDAIRGGLVGVGGSGSLANERNMLDGDALYRFTIISSTIRDWARIVGAEVDKQSPASTLRSWFVLFQQRRNSLEMERFYTKQLTSWASQIDAKLNPPRVWDLPHACPVCLASSWWSKNTHEEYPRPLVIEYRETGATLVEDARALCRSCEQVWTVRELKFQIEELEKLHEGTTS